MLKKQEKKEKRLNYQKETNLLKIEHVQVLQMLFKKFKKILINIQKLGLIKKKTAIFNKNMMNK